MRAAVVAWLVFGSTLFADEFPKYSGFVNDFASQLPLGAVQALEKKVRDYERATGNEIAVAVVPSLNGMTVDEYAQGLFRAWGVGKYGVNNGALFLWAPQERKIRIHVGLGLTGVLTDAQAGRIVQRVRDLFRSNRYEAGVNAAVDGIIEVVGSGAGAPSAGLNFVDRNSPAELERQRQEAVQREHAAAEERAADSRRMMIGLAVAAVLGVALVMIYRQRRAARWREELPQRFAESDRALADAEQRRAAAQVALGELRREAPEEVWREFEARVTDAPNVLAHQRSELDRALTMPRGSYGELHAIEKALDRWRHRMGSIGSDFGQVSATLDEFRERREHARRLLDSVSATLVRMEAQGVPGGSEGLLQAAADTYAQARQESSRNPANWLLVCDLLADVGACLEQIENPSRARYQPVRYWDGYQDSPASSALAMMYLASASSSRGGDWVSDSSGSSSGDGGDFSGGGGGDSGGFGGGDSGGGGSSSDY